MAARRAFSWSSAIRDMRADRSPVTRGYNAARELAKVYSCTRKPLVVAGQYDRAAIMQTAIIIAKAHQLRTGAAWAASLSVALKGTWAIANGMRPATAH